MPGYWTDYANNKANDAWLGNQPFPSNATVYLGLSLATANRQGNVTEPSGGSYARVAVTNNLTNWPASAFSQKSNGTQVTFPAPTGNWGLITSMFVADAPSGGNVILQADLTSPVQVNNGDPARKFAAGALVVNKV